MQEPKYAFVDGRVVNRASGETIPEDEPVFVLRGRDIHAVALLETYADLINASFTGNAEHLEAVQARIRQFEQFCAEHPDRMKEPDTESFATEGTEHDQG